MASFKNISFYVLLTVAVAIAFSAENTESKRANITGINPFCKPSSNLQLCNQLVKNATTLHEAANNAINAAIEIAKRIQGLVPFVVQAVSDLPKSTADELIKTCSDSFENSLDDLLKGLENYNNGDTNAADANLSSAQRTECTDALKQEGESVPLLTKLDAQFYKVVDNALAVAFQRYAGEMWGGVHTILLL